MFVFDAFHLDSARRLLRRGDEVIALAPKAFDVLLLLVEAGGRVVSKQELLDRVWSGLFVEEANLPQNISLVRKALGESPRDHRFIVTIPGTGYRFAAPVQAAGAAAKTTPESVAVLPFTNASADASLDYLCDGLTEGLINNLMHLPGLRVKARSVVFRFKGPDVDPQAVGRDLGVSAVVVGRLVAGVITLELVDVSSGWQLWTAQFDATPSGSLELQATMARAVATTLTRTLTSAEAHRVSEQHTRSSPAYQCYLKGRYFLNRRLTDTLRQAILSFREATDHDPQFALAYVGMADTYALQSLYGASRPGDAFPPSRAAALQALAIDDRLAEAHNSLGVVELFYGWDWPAAERAFLTALALDPDYADAHQRYGMYLTTRGRFDEAATVLARAQALDPLSLITGTIAGYPDYYSGRYEQAEQQFARVLRLDPKFSMAHFRRGLALAHLGRFEEAEAELLESKRLSDDRDVVAAQGLVWAMQGKTAMARAAVADLHDRSKATFVPAYSLAIIEAALGNHTEAFVWLDRALDERSYWMIYLDVDPALAPLRADPRFVALVSRMRPIST